MNKRKKLEIILNENPCFDNQHAWIRDISDILTFGEALRDSDWEGWENSGIDPDFTAEDVKKAIKTGKVKVYSSYPIKTVFLYLRLEWKQKRTQVPEKFLVELLN